MSGQHRGPMRLDIIIAAAVFVIAIAYTVRTTIFSSSTVTVAAPAATTLSPHEIHLNYKHEALPVHDSTNAN
jgi:hypothetical protein